MYLKALFRKYAKHNWKLFNVSVVILQLLTACMHAFTHSYYNNLALCVNKMSVMLEA